ncbi:MAG: STAS domain-containing protein [Bacteroidetes bacterium]|nr:STAS domain-containing protein [Bacteroidota bacterium]
MEITATDRGAVHLLEVKGSILGGPDAAHLNDLVHQKIKEGKNQFVVDLQHVDLINSSGLGILISNLTNVKNNGGDLRLANASSKIKQILQITKLSTVFKQYDSVEDAVRSF